MLPKICGPFHKVHLESQGFQAQRYHQCLEIGQYWGMAKSLSTESSLILWIGAFMPTLARAPARRYLSRKQRFCHVNHRNGSWAAGLRQRQCIFHSDYPQERWPFSTSALLSPWDGGIAQVSGPNVSRDKCTCPTSLRKLTLVALEIISKKPHWYHINQSNWVC